MTKRHYFRLD